VATATHGAQRRAHPTLILAICCMSVLLVGLDITIVNVALPRIGHDLHTTTSGLQWTVDAYTLVISTLLILSGSMADRFGRRRVFQMGLTLFALGSLACSLAPTLGLLVLFRALQAIGGSMLNPVAISIIRNTFEDPRKRARALGAWGATVGISLALGPVAGGALVTSVGWRSIFWVNVPIALVALGLTALFVPESRAGTARRFDPGGQLLVIVLLASLTYSIIEGHSLGWLSPTELALAAVVVLSLFFLLRVESRRTDPLLDLHFFRSRPFSGANLIALAAFAAMGGFLFLNTLYLQVARHLSPLEAGVRVLPIAAMSLIFAPISGWLVGRTGSRAPLVLAGVALTGGAAMLTGVTTSTSVVWLTAAYVIFGIGFGLVNTPISATAVGGMPPAQAGVAAAIASCARQVGSTLGVAIVGALVASSAVHGIPNGLDDDGWWFVVGCGALVFAVGLASTTRTARAGAAAVFSQPPTGQPVET
jgi:EmrB/QacA subfamily drug resistance transporter